MIQRIMVAACLQSSEETQMVINGKVSEEIRRMNEENARKMEALQEQVKATQAHRDKLLAWRLKDMEARPRRSSVRRAARAALDKIQVAWAMVWYVNRALGKKILDWGLKHGLWEEA